MLMVCGWGVLDFCAFETLGVQEQATIAATTMTTGLIRNRAARK
jgi:hypothetical protein